MGNLCCCPFWKKRNSQQPWVHHRHYGATSRRNLSAPRRHGYCPVRQEEPYMNTSSETGCVGHPGSPGASAQDTNDNMIPLYVYHQKNNRIQEANRQILLDMLTKTDDRKYFIVGLSGLRDPLMETILKILKSRLEEKELAKTEYPLSKISPTRRDYLGQPGIYIMPQKFEGLDKKEYIFLQYVGSVNLQNPESRTALMKIYFQLGNTLVYGLNRRLDDLVMEDIAGLIPKEQRSFRSVSKADQKILCLIVTSWVNPTLHAFGRDGGTRYLDEYLFKGSSTKEKLRILEVFGLPDCFLLPRLDKISDCPWVEDIVSFLMDSDRITCTTKEFMSVSLKTCGDIMDEFNREQSKKRSN